MESPVVVDKPPEYGNGGNDRGFPFDEEDSGAWSQLASRHPDIAARLRAHPQTWARKRRPSANDQTEDFGGFPFDDIPPEFREHLPSNWNRRFPEEQPPPGQPRQQYQQGPHPQGHQQGQYPQQGQSTQYQVPPQQFQGPLPQQYQGPPPQQYQGPPPQQYQGPPPQQYQGPPPQQYQGPPPQQYQGPPPQQYQGPPAPPQHQYHQQQSYQQPPPPAQRVTISTQTEPDYVNPQQTHDGFTNTADCPQPNQEPGFDERNQRSMSAPPETYANQPNMSQSPPRPDQPHQNEHSNVRHIPIFVEGRNEPVINRAPHAAEAKPAYQQAPPHPHVEREQFYPEEAPSFHHPPNFSRAFGSPFNKGFRQGPQPFTQQRAYPQAAFGRANSPQRSQSPQPHPDEHFVKVPVHHEKPAQKPESPSRPQPPPKPQQHQPPPPQQQSQSPPPPKPQTPPSNDPITQILSVQTDVLNLMTDVENFTGKKNDKQYLYLDEMLTRNLIKLDNIETEGKENIRQARKEAIRCIQKCIAVLESKATGGAAPAPDVDMDNSNQGETKNGELEMNEETKDAQVGEQNPAQVAETQSQVSDTRPDQETGEPTQETKEQALDDKKTTKKKVVKKRDKSKDAKDSPKDSNKGDKKLEAMQVDDKGDKESSQTMDVDNAAASQ